MFKKVLVPLSSDSHDNRTAKALEKAMKVCDGEIILLHVTEPVSQVVGGEQREEVASEIAAKGLAVLSPAIETLRQAKIPFHTRVEPGTVAETIVRVSDNEAADLIVMFTDGRDGLSDMLLGSITERVLRNTGRDLLAVRG